MTGVISRCLQRDRQIDVQSQRQKQRVDPGRRRRVPQSAVPLGTVAVINSHQLGAIDHPPDRRLPCAHRKVRHTPAQFRHHDGKGAGTERGRGKALAYISLCALPRTCRAPAALRWGVLFGQRWPDNDLSPSAAFCSDRRPERALAGLRSRKPRTDPTATTKCHVQMLSKDGTAGCSAHVCGAQAWVAGGGGGGGGKAAREGEGE